MTLISAAKSKAHKKYCSFCGKEISISSQRGMCRKCYKTQSPFINKDTHRRKRKIPAYRLEMEKDKNYPMLDRKEKRRIPSQAYRMYGCMSCEWKGSAQCPFGFKKGTGHALSENMHANGICKERITYLLSFTPRTDKRLSFLNWNSHYLKCKGMVEEMQDYQRLKEKETELEDMKQNNANAEDVAKAEAEISQKRAEWMDMWKSIHKFIDSKLESEAKLKATENLAKTIPISEINAMINESIEVEGKIVEEKESDEDE